MTDVTVESSRVESGVAADNETGAEPMIDPADLNADQRRAYDLVQGLCEASGMEARAVVRSAQKPYLNIEMMGADIQLTFARMGQGLDALQLLCNMILPRHMDSDVRLMLDAEGYRARRAEALTQRAVDLAREVKERNQEAELEPLPAHERRIIHSALSDDPDVSTYSEGDEPHRRIVISPVPK
jgi:spoIIIJ-associated protein